MNLPVTLRCSARNAPSLEGSVSQRSFEARARRARASKDDDEFSARFIFTLLA